MIHNAKVKGVGSDRSRQIDVLVRDRIGQYEIMIVIDCKDYKHPVDVKGVEKFNGLVEDVRAHRGVLVCPNGFTAAAKKRADGLQIDLYSPVDTDPHKWQARVTMPMICDFRSAAISFGISCSAPYPFKMPMNFFDVNEVYNKEGAALGIIAAAGIEKWNTGEFPTEAGIHHQLSIFGDEVTLMDNGYGQRIPVTLYASLYVQQQLYFGHIPISKMSGFKDEIRGSIITNAFETGLLDIEEVEAKWLKIDKTEDAPQPVQMVMQGLYGWTQ